jgi:phosphohistidine phosphatase
MRLHLIRHAKTNQFSPTGQDFDRQLMDRGWKQCAELDTYLRKYTFSNATVLCSSAARTKETLEGIKSNFKESEIHFLEELYLCSLRTYLKVIWSQTGNKELVLIGHNFGISDAANYFLDANDEMKTGEYVCISFAIDNWEEAFESTGNLADRYRSNVQ